MSLNYAEPVQEVGGSGGCYFELNQVSEGKRVEKIRAWGYGGRVRAIEIALTGGVPELYGSIPASGAKVQSYEFQIDERITELTLYTSKNADRLGHINFKTNKSGAFDAGDFKGKSNQVSDLGSGIWIGVRGRGSVDIHKLGFIFLRPVKKVEATDVTYPALLENPFLGIQQVSLDTYHNQNNTAAQPISWKFSGSRQLTKMSSWSITDTLSMSYEMEVNAGIPFVGGIEEAAECEFTQSQAVSKTKTQTKTVEWERSGTLYPGDHVDLAVVSLHAEIDIAIQGKVKVTLDNDATVSYPLSGTYKGSDYSNVSLVVDRRHLAQGIRARIVELLQS